VGKLFVLLVRIVTWSFLTVVWAVVGLLLWIPFLIRLMVIYMFSVIVSTFTASSQVSAEQALERGMSFYIDGFSRINGVLAGPRPAVIAGYSTVLAPAHSHFFLVLGHLIYTVVFWFTVFGLVMWKLSWVPPWLHSAMQWAKSTMGR
jgi:hypothetical protein